MAGNRFVWDGLEEFKLALRALPAELVAEGSSIVRENADGAKADMHYPRRAGDLADHVVVEMRAAGPFGVAAVVKNTSKLASIFENGTQARHNRLGANRGSMPPGHVFIPAIVRRRRLMYEQLADLLSRHGLQVSGTP